MLDFEFNSKVFVQYYTIHDGILFITVWLKTVEPATPNFTN